MRKWMIGLLFVALMVLFLPTGVAAQTTILHPNTVTFPCSPDHSQLTKYQMGVYNSATSQFSSKTIDIGKPTPDANNLCEASFDPLIFPVGTWYVRVVGVASVGSTSWTDPADDKFERTVLPPGKPVLTKK